MAHELKDVAVDPTDPLFTPAYKNMADYDPMNIGGPGGATINIENDEKGILEAGLARVKSRHTEAALGSEHDSFAQGIYASHHGPDYTD